MTILTIFLYRTNIIVLYCSSTFLFCIILLESRRFSLDLNVQVSIQTEAFIQKSVNACFTRLDHNNLLWIVN